MNVPLLWHRRLPTAHLWQGNPTSADVLGLKRLLWIGNCKLQIFIRPDLLLDDLAGLVSGLRLRIWDGVRKKFSRCIAIAVVVLYPGNK
jgi:hypothetical protein